MFVLNLIIKQKWFVHFFVKNAFSVLLVVSFSNGAKRYYDTFNNCINYSEAVRSVIQHSYQINKMCPNNLHELNLQLPG